MKINPNFVKRKIYKLLPHRLRLKFMRYLLPEIKTTLENIQFRAAETPKEYLTSFNLVYKVFVKTGFTSPSATPFRLAPQHCDKDTRVFIGTTKEDSDEKIIYSISLFPDSDIGLPMDTVFKKELEFLRAQGRFIVEAGHLAADPGYKMNTMNIPMRGNKILYEYAANHIKADDIVITIHPKYQWFYEDFLLFEKVGEVSTYEYANNNPAVAMRLDLRTAKENYAAAYKRIGSKNNLFEFFCMNKSDSIHLQESQTIEKKLLENIRYLYGFNR